MSSSAPKSPLTKVTRLAVGLLLIAVVGLGYLATSAGAAGRDRDGDGMPNRWEVNHGLNANRANARGDKDHDGLRNIGEFRHRTDPTDVDSDDDGSDDVDEVRHNGTDPTDADSDDDGIDDGNEDSDDDGIDDEDEDDADEVCDDDVTTEHGANRHSGDGECDEDDDDNSGPGGDDDDCTVDDTTTTTVAESSDDDCGIDAPDDSDPVPAG